MSRTVRPAGLRLPRIEGPCFEAWQQHGPQARGEILVSNRTPRTVPEFREAYKHLFAAGTIRIEKGEIIGRASDGVEVNLGSTIDPVGVQRAAKYLEDRPTPDRW